MYFGGLNSSSYLKFPQCLFLAPGGTFQGHSLQLISPSPSFCTALSDFWKGSDISFRFFLLCGPLKLVKIHLMTISFFFLINTWSGFLGRVGWYICISKYQWILYVQFSRIDPSLCIYHWLIWPNIILRWFIFLCDFVNFYPPVHF